MPTNDFLEFGAAPGANVEDQATYAADSRRTAGFATGVAPSAPFNKVWRQATAIASAWAQLAVTVLGVDMLDNGDQADKVTKFSNLVTALAWLNAVFTGAVDASAATSVLVPTVAGTADNSGKAASTGFVQAVRALLAPLASPAFTGTPTGVTPASATDSTTKIPTTAWIFNWAASSVGYTRKAWATYTISAGVLTLVSASGMSLAYVSAGVYTLTVSALTSFGTGALKINVSNGANTTPLVGFGPRVTVAGGVTIRTFTLATTAADGDFIDISLF